MQSKLWRIVQGGLILGMVGWLAAEIGGWAAPYGIALRVDAFSALLLLIVTGASTTALLAARHSIDDAIEPHRQPMFYAAWLLALAGLVGILVSADAFNIFVFMEISSLASYILVAGGPDRRTMPAVFKYLMMGTIGAILAGSCFGDHCSPISDTTIMSSMTSAADHIDHVRTQLPYALIAAVAAIVLGFLPAGMGLPPPSMRCAGWSMQ